ncbi:MAG: bacillithiol biosynthesis deacetylase BshB1 [Planctomycetota bacterium]|jgi:bacillithiol biosynthesis deacetylase BshB1
MPLDLLAIGPHPDDIEMTCAGLLLQMKKRGYRTGVLHLTHGEMGSRGTPGEREQEAKKAAEIMKVDVMEILGLPDGRVRVTESATRQVAEVLRRLRPRIVIAPFPRDPHPDHAHTGPLVAEAVHLAELRKFPGPGEPHYVSQLVFGMFRAVFKPSFVVDITDVFEEKKEAVLAYTSQVGPTKPGEAETRLASPEFLRGWEARHVYFGTLIGAAYAEAFFTEYAIPLSDPVAIFTSPQQRRIAIDPFTP